MAEVIPIPVQLETDPSFSSSAFQGSYYSQSSLLVDSPHMRPVPEPNAKTECSNRMPISPHSSTDWYHRTLQADCWNSLFHTPTPPIRVQPDTRCDKDEVHRGLLLSHDEAGHYKQSVDKVPPASPRTEDCCAVTPSSDSTSTNDSIPDSPVPTEPIEHAKDDTAMRGQPSRYVDYLSHDWKEEDVWSSWKHIVSKRKTYGSSARLENVLWRIWTKLQYRLKTVPPETLNWLKDGDVTWLYGPLQASSDKASMRSTSLTGIEISKLNSSLNKKPILKKPSVLETMLRLSLSASSLRNPAAVQARRSKATLLQQKSDTASMGRAASGYATSPSSLRPLKREDGNEFPSVSSSGEQSPVPNERKHIHFNNKVEQWIAVDFVGGDDDEDGIESYAIDEGEDDDERSSDDGFLMMKASSKPKVPNRSNRSTAQTSSSAESSTIAILPSTTLKYQEDAPKLTESTPKQGGGRLSLSPSQENLRVSELPVSTKIPLENHDENAEVSWNLSCAFANHKDGISVTYDTMQLNGGDAQGVPRRTLFGQMVDAVNTAKDIAYVIWNVGW